MDYYTDSSRLECPVFRKNSSVLRSVRFLAASLIMWHLSWATDSIWCAPVFRGPGVTAPSTTMASQHFCFLHSFALWSVIHISPLVPEAGRCLSSRPAWFTYSVPNWAGLHNEILSQNRREQTAREMYLLLFLEARSLNQCICRVMFLPKSQRRTLPCLFQLLVCLCVCQSVCVSMSNYKLEHTVAITYGWVSHWVFFRFPAQARLLRPYVCVAGALPTELSPQHKDYF